MSFNLSATRIGSSGVSRSALVLMVITTAVILALLTDLTMSRSTPLVYSVIFAGVVIGSGLMIRNRYYLPYLSNLRLRGKLLLSPLTLLLLSFPAAVIYLYYDLSGQESLLLLSGLFTSLGAAFWLSFMAVITLPAMGSVLLLGSEKKGVQTARQQDGRKGVLPGQNQDDLPGYCIGALSDNHPMGEMNGDPWKKAIIASVILAFVFVVISLLTGIRLSGAVFVLPFAAILMLLLDVIIVDEFRLRLSGLIAEESEREEHRPLQMANAQTEDGFRNVILVGDHYPELIAGRTEYLTLHAGDAYAAEITALAARTFDPALLPALKVIASGNRFSEKVRQEASAGITIIRKYYSDPLRNSDLLRLPGIPDKIAMARGIMLNSAGPQENDLAKLLSDPNPVIRRTGLMAAGRYGLTGLIGDIVRALANPETAREAFHALRQFGPDVYGEIIGTAIKTGNSEKENIIIMKLLDAMPLAEALPWLADFVATANMSIRQKAACNLCSRGWRPEENYRQMIRETIIETVHTVARLISLQTAANRTGSFLLAASLSNERKLCTGFLFCLLSLLTGQKAAEMMMLLPVEGDSFHAAIASEAVDTAIENPARRPLRALLGNSTDADRLAELSLCFPVRPVMKRSLLSTVLAREQNITGIWTKACALHKAAQERKGLEREQVVSYLFSNSPILQEESAAAIRNINPAWYEETESRLQEPSRSRITAVVKGTMQPMAMIFEKTRFLSLCFNNIPEEKLILLASGMRYSESYDTTSVPGVLSWVVPSEDGKTGIYSLPVNDIAVFVFYYSEFTDIFVRYMDNQGKLYVS